MLGVFTPRPTENVEEPFEVSLEFEVFGASILLFCRGNHLQLLANTVLRRREKTNPPAAAIKRAPEEGSGTNTSEMVVALAALPAYGNPYMSSSVRNRL